MTQPDLFRSPESKARVHDAYRAALNAWPVPHQESRIPTGQGETFVISYGKEDAPAVMLLHLPRN